MNRALKLPDGGAKLKAKLEEISHMLNNKDDITNKVSSMSLSDNKVDVRKETVLRSNKTSDTHQTNLLRAHDSDHVSKIYIYINKHISNSFYRQEQHA